MKAGETPSHYFSEGKIPRLNHLYDTKENVQKKKKRKIERDNSFFSLYFWRQLYVLCVCVCVVNWFKGVVLGDPFIV